MPEKVLDVGCGCGSFTAELSPHCKKITAIEFSPGLIKRCKDENQKPNITYLCMDGRNIGFPDNSFDLVISDIRMPGVGGMDIYSFLKSKQMEARVIMVTADPFSDDIALFLKENNVKYIKKPFELMKFKQKVLEKLSLS